MAYNKRNWKARQGTGLNFFSIDGATPVPIVNQPTTLTEAGDALSAGNLNDWEQRIEDGFDDADASIANVQGNLETYETTNDMRVAANSQDIQNIQTALSGTVIQEHVDSTQKNVKTILSADELLPWAILKRVGARSTQFNQLVKDGNFPDSTTNWDSTYGSISIANNKLTYTVETVGNTYQNRIYQRLIWFVPSHKYLLMLDVKGSRNSEIYGSIYDSSTSTYAVDRVLMGDITANSTTRLAIIFDIGANPMLQADLRISIGATGKAIGDTYEFSNVQIEDITLMNEYDSNKTDAENIASFRAKFPASYYPFNAGDIYDVPPLSFLCRGTNQWSEEWEEGIIYSNGSLSPAGTTGIRSKYYERCLSSTQYYLVSPSNVFVSFYDSDYNFISREGNEYSITSPVNAFYFKISTATDYGTTYNHDIMICLNSVTDKTYKPFIGQTIDTSFMAGKKYVNSSCYDYAENVYVNGILKRKNQTVVGSVDLGTLAWSYNSNNVYFYAPLESMIIPLEQGIMPNFVCGKYETTASASSGGWASKPDKVIGSRLNVYYVCVKDSAYTDADTFKTAMSGVYLLYELATLPDPTYGDPIPNFPCEDGSTIMANTPQTELVNAIDVPSTIGYSTKIA